MRGFVGSLAVLAIVGWALPPVAQAQGAPHGSWTLKAPMPAARAEVAAVVVGNKLYVLGGNVDNAAVPGNAEYDPATDRWRERAPLPAAHDHLGLEQIPRDVGQRL